jgi:hypothetical protein
MEKITRTDEQNAIYPGTCSECKQVIKEVVEFHGYEESIVICKGCLQKALEMLR